MPTRSEVDKRLGSLTEEEREALLLDLITALHAEDTDECYRLLRNNDLEADQIDDIDSRDEPDPGDMDGDHDTAMDSIGWGLDESYDHGGDDF